MADSVTPSAESLTVAVWRSSWLPKSETFIRNQTDAMTRWRAVRVGLRVLPDGLPVRPDFAPFTRTITSRIRFRISERAGHRFAFGKFLSTNGVRLIHAHFGPGGFKAQPIARRAGLPLVVTFHGFDVTQRPAQPGAAGERYRRQLGRLFDQASALIAVSEFVAGKLRALGAPAEKVRVRYIGIPVDGPDAARPRGSDRSGIVFVGRLIERKGVHQLLDAFARLPAELQKRHRLTIVGGGELAGALGERIVREDLNAELTGFRTSAQVAELLARAAVFCGPSVTVAGDEEAFGMVFLEAALAGCPVVAYNSGGIAEAVVDGVTGLLADEGDVQGLADRLAMVLGDPTLAAELGATGEARVRADFDIRSRTAELESLYDEVTKEFPSPRSGSDGSH